MVYLKSRIYVYVVCKLSFVQSVYSCVCARVNSLYGQYFAIYNFLYRSVSIGGQSSLSLSLKLSLARLLSCSVVVSAFSLPVSSTALRSFTPPKRWVDSLPCLAYLPFRQITSGEI